MCRFQSGLVIYGSSFGSRTKTAKGVKVFLTEQMRSQVVKRVMLLSSSVEHPEC